MIIISTADTKIGNKARRFYMSEAASELKTTAEVAKKVLLNMGQREIPLTPENYQIWFEYCAGSNESTV